jgi:hypothetical protein
MYGNTKRDGTGNFWHVRQNAAGVLYSSDGDVEILLDTIANSSDKVITIPAGYTWIILGIRVTFVSSASTGNRQLVIQFRDESNNVLFDVRAGAVQAAGVTRYYNFGSGMPDMTSFRDTDYLSTPLPSGFRLDEGFDIRVYDKSAIDASADDMTIAITYLSVPVI